MSQVSEFVTVITPSDRARVGILGCFREMVLNLINSRELLFVLFKRDFFAVYKKSFLGLAWLAISPVVSILSWVFLYFTNVLNPGTVDIPYPAFILLSSAIWSFFVGFYLAAADTLASGSSFILQVKYPHEVLLVKQIAQHLAASAVNLVAVLIVVVLFGVVPSPLAVVTVPFLLIPAALLASGVGLVVSVLGVVVPEIRKVMDIAISLLIWITPIVYTTQSKDPLLQKVLSVNPLTYLVAEVRDFLLSGTIAHWDKYAISAGLAFIVFLVSWRVFYLSEHRVVEKMI